MVKWVFLNGDFVEEENAVLHFSDLSFQRGYGIFDFFRLSGNHPLFLDDHLQRFFFSAAQMHLPMPLAIENLKAAIFNLIEKNNWPDTGIRLSLTGGFSADSFSIGKPNLLISQHTITPPTGEQVRNGIRLLTHSYQRPLPQIKSINYEMAIWLQPKRLQSGADDLLYEANGLISECPRSNIFLVTTEDTLVTPTGNVLSGITRNKVLQLAPESIRVEERNIGLEEVQTAKEVFITSTTKQILPVVRVNDWSFPPGKITAELLRQLQTFTQKEASG